MIQELQRINPGDPIPLSAAFWNRLTEIVAEDMRGQRGERAPQYPGQKRYVKNQSGLPLDDFNVVGIGEMDIVPNQAVAPESFKTVTVVNSQSPATGSPFAVVQGPCPLDGIVEMLVSGETWVLVDFADTAHGYADCINGNYQNLASQESIGPAKILWKEDGTGLLWAWALLDPNMGAVDAAETLHVRARCEIDAGTLTETGLERMTSVVRNSAGSYTCTFALQLDPDDYTFAVGLGTFDTVKEVSRTSLTLTLQTLSGTDTTTLDVTIHGKRLTECPCEDFEMTGPDMDDPLTPVLDTWTSPVDCQCTVRIVCEGPGGQGVALVTLPEPGVIEHGSGAGGGYVSGEVTLAPGTTLNLAFQATGVGGELVTAGTNASISGFDSDGLEFSLSADAGETASDRPADFFGGGGGTTGNVRNVVTHTGGRGSRWNTPNNEFPGPGAKGGTAATASADGVEDAGAEMDTDGADPGGGGGGSMSDAFVTKGGHGRIRITCID